ncbi:hypothetical protein LY76DRAFT_100170 [Colletotrichum caudatum]|nr:hypothetical protein LY76DRAFT_100170 [Colletotrichum caudatum]
MNLHQESRLTGLAFWPRYPKLRRPRTEDQHPRTWGSSSSYLEAGESSTSPRTGLLIVNFSLAMIFNSAPFQATWDVEFQVASCTQTGQAGSEHKLRHEVKA